MQINLNAGSRGKFEKRMDLDTLPAEHTERGSRVAGVFVMLFALVWGGGPTAGFITLVSSGEFQPMLLFMLVFTVIGAGLFVLGLYLLTQVTTTRIDGKTVFRDARWLFGHKVWEEPLGNYPGVVQRSEYHSGGKNSPSYTLYIVELHHDDKKRRLRLYESRSDAGIRGIWEDCCRKLDKPALEDDGGSLRARAVEDLDKSVRELAREGKVKVAFDPSVPPPRGLTLSVQGDVLRITLDKGRMPVPGLLLFLAIPAVFIYIGFFVREVPLLFGIAGIVLLVAILAAVAWSAVARTVLEVRRGNVKLFWQTPWGNTPGMSMESDAVESVKIGPPAGNTRAAAVLIAGDSGTIPVGQGLGRDALEWLRNCILAVITK